MVIDWWWSQLISCCRGSRVIKLYPNYTYRWVYCSSNIQTPSEVEGPLAHFSSQQFSLLSGLPNWRFMLKLISFSLKNCGGVFVFVKFHFMLFTTAFTKIEGKRRHLIDISMNQHRSHSIKSFSGINNMKDFEIDVLRDLLQE